MVNRTLECGLRISNSRVRDDQHVILDRVRDPSLELHLPDGAEQIEAARIHHCRYQSLGPLTKLSGLRTLVVATWPDDSLELLRSLPRLEYLYALHMPRVHDLSPLRTLAALRVARLATLPSWDSSGKVQVVESLEPLASLPALQHLELFGVRPESKSLAELEHSTSLLTARVSKYSKAEVARYRTATGVGDAYAPRPWVDEWN